MELCSSLAFTVKRREPELVVPKNPTPHELKNLSDIDDQEGCRFQIPFIFFYKKNSLMDGHDPVRVIKEALGRALVHYYPLAGRIREGYNRKLSVDCSGEGVLFIEATADTTLEKLGDTIYQPSQILDDVLFNVPESDGIVGCPLLLLQVTRLLCGGFILVIRLNHAISDGFGLVQFLKTAAEMARGATIPSIPPVWERELLNAREPPRITFEHHEYEDTFEYHDYEETFVATKVSLPSENDLMQHSFFFDSGFMKAIRTRLPKRLADYCSQYDLLMAVFWKCRTLALKLDPEVPVQISCVVNCRGKLAVNLPVGFYGNASAFPAAISTSGLLCTKPLAYAVKLVMEAKARMSEEYIRSVTDYMVIRGRPPLKSNNWNIVVSDTRLVGFGEVDFGWGSPVYAGPAAAECDISTFAKYKNNGDGRAGIVLNVCLPRSAMNRFDLELKKMIYEPNMIISML